MRLTSENVLKLGALVLALSPLGACMGPANPTAARAAELANVVSRASSCRAATPKAGLLDSFFKTERAKGATDAQIASARSTYITVSEGATVNQRIKPVPCTPDERVTLKGRMTAFGKGTFEGL
ncbi:MAG: hypothetical protein ACRDBH_04750 [Bosea sp. (in: a-proteobacteria)]